MKQQKLLFLGKRNPSVPADDTRSPRRFGVNPRAILDRCRAFHMAFQSRLSNPFRRIWSLCYRPPWWHSLCFRSGTDAVVSLALSSQRWTRRSWPNCICIWPAWCHSWIQVFAQSRHPRLSAQYPRYCELHPIFINTVKLLDFVRLAVMMVISSGDDLTETRKSVRCASISGFSPWTSLPQSSTEMVP